MTHSQSDTFSAVLVIVLLGWIQVAYYYIKTTKQRCILLCIVILSYILYHLLRNRNKESFMSFKSKEEKYAFCDTIEKAGAFCVKNNSKMCKDYTKSLKDTKMNLNKLLLQANKNSFEGDATNQKKPEV